MALDINGESINRENFNPDNVQNSVKQNCLQRGLNKVENGVNKAVSFCARKMRCLNKSGPIILKVLLVFATVCFLWKATLPTLAGILIGAVFRDKVEKLVKRVVDMLKNLPILGKVAIGIAATALCFAFPSVSGLVIGGYAGSQLYRLTARPQGAPAA